MSESYWWCSNCKEEVDDLRVTYQEKHENCGHTVECIATDKQERISELEASRSFLCHRVADLDAELDRYRTAPTEAIIQVAALEAEIAPLQKRFETVSTTAAELGCENSELKDRIIELETELATAKDAMRGAIPIVAPVLKMLGFHRDDACRWNNTSGLEIGSLKAENGGLRDCLKQIAEIVHDKIIHPSWR